jgi:hypothetical protein
MPAGMSVRTSSPAGPVTRHLSPSIKAAVAGAFLTCAFSGCSPSIFDVFSIASRTCTLDVAAPS